MKQEMIVDALNELDDNMIIAVEAVRNKKESRKGNIRKWSIPACIAVILVSFIVIKMGKETADLSNNQPFLANYSKGVEIKIVKELPKTDWIISSEACLAFLKPEEIFAENTAIFRGIVRDFQYGYINNTDNNIERYFSIIDVEIIEVYRGEIKTGNTYRIYLPIAPGIVTNSIAGDLENLEIGSEAIFMPYPATKEKGISFGKSKFFAYADVAEFYFSEGQRFLFLKTEDGVSYDTSAYHISAKGGQITLDDVVDYIKKYITA